jgi:hypothetical protein
MLTVGRRVFGVALAALAATSACTPDVGSNPTPASLEFDLTSTPPRVPQPTFLVVNPTTGHIDFSLAGTPIPADCSTQSALTPAQCEFDQFLQTLDGFPSVTPATAPATAPLDPATLTVGQNVVVVGVKGSGLVTTVPATFDTTASALTVGPPPTLWTLGEFYWIGVRAYLNGVHAVGGGEVVGSPTMALLKQDTPLTCGATDPTQVDPQCPAFRVLVRGTSPTVAAMQLFQLETVRLAYLSAHGFDAMAAAGLPKTETGVLWGFPIQTSSVPVLVPTAGVVPMVVAPNQLRVLVQGTVDPATVSVIAPGGSGSVLLLDLTVAATNFPGALLPATAAYDPTTSTIAITASAALPAGHQLGVFMTSAIHDTHGAPLVASPVTVLLALTSPLVDSAGHSTVSGVSDSNAAALEAGRQALAQLYNNPGFAAATGITRQNLIYGFAFPVQP